MTTAGRGVRFLAQLQGEVVQYRRGQSDVRRRTMCRCGGERGENHPLSVGDPGEGREGGLGQTDATCRSTFTLSWLVRRARECALQLLGGFEVAKTPVCQAQLEPIARPTHDRRHLRLRACDMDRGRRKGSPARCCRRETAGRQPTSTWLRKVVSSLAGSECMTALVRYWLRMSSVGRNLAVSRTRGEADEHRVWASTLEPALTSLVRYAGLVTVQICVRCGRLSP